MRFSWFGRASQFFLVFLLCILAGQCYHSQTPAGRLERVLTLLAGSGEFRVDISPGKVQIEEWGVTNEAMLPARSVAEALLCVPGDDVSVARADSRHPWDEPWLLNASAFALVLCLWLSYRGAIREFLRWPRMRAFFRIVTAAMVLGTPLWWWGAELDLWPYTPALWGLGIVLAARAGAPWTSKPRPWLSDETRALSPYQCAAILLMSLAPEVSAQVFKELGPEHVHELTLVISKLPPIHRSIRREIMALAMSQVGGEWFDMTAEDLEEIARRAPKRLAELVIEWMASAPPGSFHDWSLGVPRLGRRWKIQLFRVLVALTLAGAARETIALTELRSVWEAHQFRQLLRATEIPDIDGELCLNPGGIGRIVLVAGGQSAARVEQRLKALLPFPESQRLAVIRCASVPNSQFSLSLEHLPYVGLFLLAGLVGELWARRRVQTLSVQRPERGGAATFPCYRLLWPLRRLMEFAPLPRPKALFTLRLGQELRRPVAEGKNPTGKLERSIQELVDETWRQLGLRVPSIAIMDCPSLAARDYTIEFRGEVVAHGAVGIWRSSPRSRCRGRSELGFRPPGGEPEAHVWLTAHLKHVIGVYRRALLTPQVTLAMLESLAGTEPHMVSEVIRRYGHPLIHGVLSALVKRRISLAPLADVMASLYVYQGEARTEMLVEAVCCGLAETPGS